MWPVDKRVGNVRNNGRELVEPVQDLVATMHEAARGVGNIER
jgi:hypothetical protein